MLPLTSEHLFLSIIIPCYNEQEVITDTLDRVLAVAKKLSVKDFEIVLVNDGSSDKTWSLLYAIAQSDPRIKLLNFSRNFGHQVAVTAGLHHCKGDIAIIVDADLQDPPELFPEMIHTYLEQDCDVVYGVRTARKGETWFKKLTAKMFYRWLNWLSDVSLAVDSGDFRLVDRKVIDALSTFKERNKYLRGLISWMGFHQVPIYYEREPRLKGETKYPLRKMLKLASNAMFYFSKKPLKLALSLGLISIILGFLMIAVVFFKIFATPEDTVPGWASLIITVIFFGGVQLLTLGVLGEYIGNIFDEVKNRPEYLVSHKVNIP